MIGKSEWQNMKTRGVRIGAVAVTLIALVVMIISTLHNPAQNVKFFNTADELKELSEGWTLYDGDISYSLTLPSRDEFELTNNTVTLVNTLPDDLQHDAAFLFRTSLQSLRVYLEDELIYSYGDEKYRLFGGNNGSIWNIVDIPPHSEGKEIKLVISSPYKDYECTFNDFYIGDYQAAISFLWRTYGQNVLFILVTMIIGIALLIYYFFLKFSGIMVAKQMLFVSLMAINVAAWEFTECKLTQILVGNMAGFSACNFLLLALMPLPMAMYVDAVEKQYYHKIFVMVEFLIELNVIVQILLQIFGVMDFYNMLYATHLFILIMAVTALVTLAAKFKRHREPGLMLLIISLSFLALAGLVEIVINYATGYVAGTTLIIAVMLVVLATGIESVRIALATIAESKRALEESAAKTTFLANMSHEIRTPMNAIYAMSELLANAEDMTAGNRDFAKTIRSSTENLLEIINDLLDFSKISAQKYDIIPEEYELSEIVTDIREIIALRANAKGLKLNMHIDPNIPFELRGDVGRIRQILLNLLNNAVKYTKEGEISLRIDYERIDGERIKLIMTVADTGIGIMPEDMDDLFEAFVQVDKQRNKASEGTGLGLAISRALAVMMGGNISVTSEYGVGSTFTATVIQETRSEKTFKQEIHDYYNHGKVSSLIIVESGFETTGYIKMLCSECDADYITCGEEEISEEVFMKDKPVVLFTTRDHPYLLSEEFRGENPFVRTVGVAGPAEAVDTYSNCEILRVPLTCVDILALTRPEISDHQSIDFSAPEAKVMVVDDNIVNLRVMKEMLRKYNIRPTLCADGTQAVEAMKIKNFDLIFMDHMMPGMDGIETTALIRELPGMGDSVKIIALSANAMKGVEKVFKDNGFDSFVAKPVSLAEIGKVLKKYLPKDLIKEV